MSTLTATVFGARPQTAAEDRLTEAGAAERFARLHGDDLRYDFRRARWLTYFGHRWTPDADGAMTRRALEFARTWQREAVDIPDRDKREATFKAAIRLERRDALQSMLALARDLKPIADAGDQWDSDPMLLGVVNGVVDLRTGILRDGCRADRITMQTAYPFDPDAQRPRFERFVLEVSDGDTSLANYHQYIAGMALTGDVSEQILPMWIGRGSNGKSTLLHVLLEVWGDYGEVAAFSTFERAAVRGSIPNDLAALAGKRLVVASETREGARLDEGRLKSITGGDRLKARFLNREWFSFEPTFTLILCISPSPAATGSRRGSSTGSGSPSSRPSR